jgi:serine protease Do
MLMALGMTAATTATASDGFDRAIETVMPRVVKLYGLSAGLEKGYGSGVVVSSDGLVLTVYALLIDARDLTAVTSDGVMHEVSVVHRDAQRQLALLQLEPLEGETDGEKPGKPDTHPFFDLAQEAALEPGDWVLAAGNPFKVAAGGEPLSVVHGVFSTRTRLDARRRLRDYPYRGDVLVIDAITSNPGAPGGALVNLRGEFVGMIGRQVVSNLTHTHLNHAFPRDVLYDFLVEATTTRDDRDQAASSGTDSSEAAAAPVDSGIRLSRVGYRRVLPFVDRVIPGSPAERAGVRGDDLILSVNGRNVADAADYDHRVKELTPDEPLDLVIRRGRTVLTIRVETEQ